MFNCDRNFAVGIASRETIRFLILQIISKCQRSWRQLRDVTVMWNFQTGLWDGKQLYAGLASAFEASLLPTHFKHLCFHKWAGRGSQTDFVPGREKPYERHWVKITCC